MKPYLRQVLAIASYAAIWSAAAAAPFAYIPNSTSGTVSVIDIASNIAISTIVLPTQSGPQVIAINPAGTRAYTMGTTGVHVINTFTNAVSAAPVLVGFAGALALNSSGTRLYATIPQQSAGQVCVLDTSTNTSPGCVNVGAAPYGVAVSPDGMRLYVTNMNANSVSVVDTSASAVIATISVGAEPWGVTFNRAGTRAYVTNLSPDTVTVFDTADNSIVGTVHVGNNPIGLVTSRDDTRLYVTNAASESVSIIDTSTNSVIDTITVGTAPVGISLSPRGDRLYVASSSSNTVSVIRTADYAVVDTIMVGTTPYARGQFIGGGRLLDIDGDGEVFATTDMVLMMRWQLGFRGAALIAKAVAQTGATRTAWEQIEAYLRQLDTIGAAS